MPQEGGYGYGSTENFWKKYSIKQRPQDQPSNPKDSHSEREVTERLSDKKPQSSYETPEE